MVEGLEDLRLAGEAEGVVRRGRPEELEHDVVTGAAMHGPVRLALRPGARQTDQLVAAVDARRRCIALRVCPANRRERAAQLFRRLRAVLGLEREGCEQYTLQVLRRVAARMCCAQRFKRLLGDLAGHELVQRGPEPEHVEARVGRREARLQRQVARGAERLAVLRGPPLRCAGW